MGKPHKFQKEIIAWANGEAVEVYSPITDSWMKATNPIWGEGYDFRIKPEREYPACQLGNEELIQAYTTYSSHIMGLAQVGKAAIRRYIDDQENKE